MSYQICLDFRHKNALLVRVYTQLPATRVDASELERAWIRAPIVACRAGEHQGVLRCHVQKVVLVADQCWLKDEVGAFGVEVGAVDHKLPSGLDVDDLVRFLHGWGRDHHGHVLSRTKLVHTFDLQLYQPKRHTFDRRVFKPPEKNSTQERVIVN